MNEATENTVNVPLTATQIHLVYSHAFEICRHLERQGLPISEWGKIRDKLVSAGIQANPPDTAGIHGS